jgi:cytochrome c5
VRVKSKALIVAAVTCIGGLGSSQAIAQAPSAPSSPASAQRAVLNQYCVLCHNETLKTAGLLLDKADVEHVNQDPAIWEKVVRRLRTESMPPTGMPRPDKTTYESLATYLETTLDAAAAVNPNPGRPSAVHRLNRTEYTNAIRDVLALDVDGQALLPPDESGHGFDNSGEILSVSEMLMERYLIAARQISRTAVGDPTLRPVAMTFSAPKTGLQFDRESDDLPFGSRGGMAVKYSFPLDGEYSIKIRLLRTKGIEGPRIIGLGEPRQLDVRLDGKRVQLFAIGGEKDLRPEQVEERLELRFPAKAGTRTVGVTFLNEDLAAEGMLRPLIAEVQLKGWGARDDSRRPPGVESVSISGPYNAQGAAEAPSRAKIFICTPKAAKEEERCAKQILANLARYAYRRPVTAADTDTLLQYYKVGRDAQKSGNRFEEGIRMALETMLVSPDFLFRMELDPPKAAQQPRRVNDIEMASRLSFFLWSSIPDKELLDLAAAGKLTNPATLQQQVRRMLLDPRAQMLVDSFFGQWLGLRNAKTHAPDIIAFPDFDDDLREAFQQETSLLFASMLREDRSVVELLNADYTYANERLARHYGIPDVYGSHFRRVTLADENRWGILGKGAILMVTSLPNRTSPVLRGKWVMENVMGAPPPPPPPNVPAFPENKTDFTQLTVRQRLEMHRANPFCASCHSRMDPLGFAFDNFDPVGKWRKAEAIQILGSPELPVMYTPLDPSGVLPNGTAFQGPTELRKILVSEPENFAHVVTDRLLTYALGRGLDYYDAPAVRRIVRDAAANDYRWSSIIMGIVSSTPFQMRAPASADPPAKVSEESKVQANLR